MAQTPAAVQTQLGTSPQNATIIQAREAEPVDSTHQQWYVVGNVDAPGRARWCTTNAVDSAATQAASILSTLRST